MHRRFSLLELMTVVGIIAVLTAIAIPQVYKAHLSAKRTEVIANAHSMQDALRMYYFDNDAAVEEQGNGGGIPTGANPKRREPWPAGTNFDRIGWVPDGDVYGAYALYNSGTSMWCASATSLTRVPAVMASINGDGDTTAFNIVCCVDDTPGTMFSTPVGQCGAMELDAY